MDGSLLSHPALPPHPALMDWQLSASILCVVPCPMNALSIPSIEDIVPGVEDQNRWVCNVRHFLSAVHIIRIRSIKLACLLEKHYRYISLFLFQVLSWTRKIRLLWTSKWGRAAELTSDHQSFPAAFWQTGLHALPFPLHVILAIIAIDLCHSEMQKRRTWRTSSC